ncbi:Type I restriction-modification system, specificity subunit S (EC [uncultured Gammaproteobacteria bacterium]|uniref:restriction endonuclease subunit S n=1 Tax=thiotrophic endosymbiont of Bathymodiolus puteoserpentis (Logatchev) TaxID=343240 RepID=UPI0010B260C0|nr:restriction endonuclease subunit S [thiotrophic endosymbiont of Bathymodiolus puteoserpentis (Logatchev)]CAC9499736.1 Type I restriction-modification system, specificity subunit S [uncultured Gammaproteobacteria bacterium]CAC9569225.1 Type I restriction-modification system, specificity subunit S [uncultured Gammaproteobacteria bacterium]CAC9587393.1 Type I restriction-modification system, specificity subunit S [uncultured Gammaproteobacteria bacterium]CAC9639493.1 Type I restriction-modifica
MNNGLSDKQLKQIIDVLRQYKDIDKAVLFGSRAMGNYKKGSDVDIAIMGKNADFTLAAKIKSHLEDDTYLPYFFDVISYNTIKSDELKEHIRRYGKIILSGEKKIPKGWVETTLGEVGLEVLNGYAFKSKNFISSKSGNNELPVLKIKNVANGNTNHNDVVFHKVSFSLEKYIIKKGDTLIALTGNHPFAKTQVVGGVSKYRLPIKSLLNQRVAKIFSKEKSMLHNEILYYFFKWNNTQFHIGNQSSGSASQANISKNDLLNIPINLPPLPEQVAIAKILTVFDDKIELLQAQNKTLETTAQTIFKEWFGKYQIGDELPEGWRMFQMDELVETINGYSYKGKDLVEESDEALVSLKSFDRNGGFQTRGFKPFKGNPKDTQEVQIGDLVVAHTDLTQDAEVLGNPAFIFDNGGFKKMYITMDLVKVISIHKDISSSFLYYLMKDRAFKGHCVGYSNGTTVLHLSKKAIPEYQVFLPSNLGKVKEFSKIANATTSKISLNKDELKYLKQTRDTLLPKLMSGQLRVDEFKENAV